MRLMITRPKQDAAPLAARLVALGHEVLEEPLLEIMFRQNVQVPLAGAAALLATSANGVRALARATDRRDLPLFAVGDATARTARTAGYDQVFSAAGDVLSLADIVADNLIPAEGHLVHAAGTRVTGDLQEMLFAQGFRVQRVTLYEARTSLRFTPIGNQALQTGQVDGVLFYSPHTARTFVNLCTDAGIGSACRDMVAYCLSPAVAQTATQRPDDLTWHRVCEATHPDEGSLIELLETPS
ncbi:MAG TPA: uroporphyrinogen-III synthase [Sneathiellales bacterium]|nr:uroporphyrinogen-III synthase [Sneathiellales bacterium]